MQAIPTSPLSARYSVSGHNAAKWCIPVNVSAPIPMSFVALARAGRPTDWAIGAKQPCPFTLIMAGVTFSTLGLALPLTFPLRSALT